MELRSNIAERVAHGDPLDGVLRQLGDPLTLAESYLASIPLTAAAPPRAFRPDRVRARRALRLHLVHGRHRVPYGLEILSKTRAVAVLLVLCLRLSPVSVLLQ